MKTFRLYTLFIAARQLRPNCSKDACERSRRPPLCNPSSCSDMKSRSKGSGRGNRQSSVDGDKWEKKRVARRCGRQCKLDDKLKQWAGCKRALPLASAWAGFVLYAACLHEQSAARASLYISACCMWLCIDIKIPLVCYFFCVNKPSST